MNKSYNCLRQRERSQTAYHHKRVNCTLLEIQKYLVIASKQQTLDIWSPLWIFSRPEHNSLHWSSTDLTVKEKCNPIIVNK